MASPPAEDETAVSSFFLKQQCEKQEPGRRFVMEARMMRKPGQGDVDPATGEYRSGQFERWTRFEISDPGDRKR